MSNNSNKQKPDISYFRLSLVQFLNENFPLLSLDNNFISSRSEAASQEYEQAIRNGYNHIEAQEYANEILFRDLHYSKYNMLVTILWNEFAGIVEPEYAKAFAAELLPGCEAVFEKYLLSDNFEDESEFELLYTELTGTISIYIDEHGLQ